MPVTLATFQEKIKEGTSIWLFTTKLCPDCRRLKVFFPELITAYPHIYYEEVDAHESSELAQRLGIYGVPSMVAFHRGLEIARYASRLPKPREQVEQFLMRVEQIATALDEMLAEKKGESS
ncbi:MAG: thioredoxin family protein [Candidatus Carbobacillus altaicus]|nr:thioredoxin family protein [Candidatus Carbobacillus altaicus]